MLSEIFHVQQYAQTRSKFDLNYDKMRIQPQIVAIPEGAASTFFTDKRSWDNSKLFFEGMGYVFEAKNQHPIKLWEDTFIMVDSNTLPYVLSDAVSELDNKVHRHAFRQRIAFTHFTKSYQNTDIFPYDVRDLASYLQERMKEIKNDMSEKEEEHHRKHKMSLKSSVTKAKMRVKLQSSNDDIECYKTPKKKLLL